MQADLSNISLIRTKLHRPPVAAVHVHRPRLLDCLNDQLIKPLTVVSAPAGYGKSTLLSCWLEACDLPSAWLSLDEIDNDLRLFLSYFLAAIQSVFPNTCKDCQLILKSPELPPLPALIVHLINEVDKIEQPFILVIDDYHLVKTRAIHELLEEIMKHPPRAMHLVLASRTDPPLPLAGLRARGQLNEIRMRDLRFSRQETSDFLSQMLSSPVDEKLSAKFEEKTEGWITGLHLAALSLRNREDMESVISSLPDNNRYVVDYLVAEILLQQEPAIQIYLLKTSILDRFCAPLCDAVCNSKGATPTDGLAGQEFIQQVIDSNLFVIPLDNKHGWYRFHHSFQEILERRLELRFKPDEISALHLNASTWLSGEGFVEEALQHAIRSGDLDAAAGLISRHRHEIMNTEQWHRLDRWLKMLPPGEIWNEPGIVIMKACLCGTWFRLVELKNHLKQVANHFDTEPPSGKEEWRSLRAEYYTLKAFLCYLDGDSKQMIDLSGRALNDLVSEAQSTKSLTLCMLSFGHQMNGDLNTALDVLYNALSQKGPGETTLQSRLFLSLSLVHWIAADLDGMHQAAGRILALHQESNQPESVVIATHFEGIFHYLRNEPEKANEFLDKVVRHRLQPNLLNFTHSTFAMALCFESQGRSESAQELVQMLINKALDSGSGEFLQLAEAFQAELMLRQGKLAPAQFWARNYEAHPFDPGYRFYVPQFTLVKVLLAEDSLKSLQQAAALLSELHEYYSSIHNSRFLIEVHLLQTLLHDSLDEASKSMQSLDEALRLAEPGGFIRPFLDLGDPMAVILQRVTDSQSCQKFAMQILAEFKAEPSGPEHLVSGTQSQGEPSLTRADLLEPLTSREIQILQVLSQGLSNQAIADKLFISPETVKRHLYNIFQKLDVKNRQQAITKANSFGLI